MLWRAALADGRVVTEEGGNTPQEFLDQIIRFELVHDGVPRIVLEPSPDERVVFRRRTKLSMNGDARVSVVVGLLSKVDGGHLVAEIGDGPVRFSRDVVLTEAEVS